MTINEIEQSICLKDNDDFWKGKVGPDICADASGLSYNLEELKSLLDTASFIISDYTIRDMRSLDQYANQIHILNTLKSSLSIIRRLKKALKHIDRHLNACCDDSEFLYSSIIEKLINEDQKGNADEIAEIVKVHMHEQKIEQMDEYSGPLALNDEVPF